MSGAWVYYCMLFWMAFYPSIMIKFLFYISLSKYVWGLWFNVHACRIIIMLGSNEILFNNNVIWQNNTPETKENVKENLYIECMFTATFGTLLLVENGNIAFTFSCVWTMLIVRQFCVWVKFHYILIVRQFLSIMLSKIAEKSKFYYFSCSISRFRWLNSFIIELVCGVTLSNTGP